MVDYINVLFNTTNTLYNAVMYGIVILIFITIIILIYVIRQYKHKFRVRELTGGKTRIIDDKAREIKDEGVLKWKLLSRRHIIPVPPSDVIHITKNGSLSVEAYFTQTGEYKYVKDNGINNEMLDNFHALSTQDREFYTNEMRKAEEYKKKGIWDILRDSLPFIAILLIFILMLVFWEDIAKPGITIVEKAGEIAKSQEETARILRDTIQNRQTINNKEINNFINKTDG